MINVGFRVSWDGEALAQFVNFAGFDVHMNDLLEDLAKSFGEAGVAYIKPEVRGNGRWQPSTGATAQGIGYDVDRRVDGFTLYFTGDNMSDDGRHNIAHMIDVGNWPSHQPMYAWEFGMQAFPISARVGAVTDYLGVIHGMGHMSSEYPKHFSDSGLDYLYDNVDRLAEKAMDDFLDKLVI